MPAFDAITRFVREQTGYNGPLTEATTLQHDLGLHDEALWEFLGSWAAHFAVDVSDFRWSFHATQKPSWLLGCLRIFLPLPQVKQIPITLGMLHNFAACRHWELEYPSYSLSGP